jgi:esterase/lipase superfamily enzyme
LFFATTRKPIDASDISRGYSGERDDEQVHFGQCTVTVPRSHQIGSLGKPWWKELLTLSADGRLELQWSSLRALGEDAHWQAVRAQLGRAEDDGPVSLAFIHGYNVSFEEAALRAAQLGVDLKINGVMSFFSWASKGRFKGYAADVASVEAVEEELAAYLDRLAEMVGGGRLNVIAHSMGNRALSRSMQKVFSRLSDQTKLRFGQIILAAPDVDAGLFRRDSGVYHAVSKRTTLYTSEKDKALAYSGIIHDFPRAGYLPPITIVSGVDTVEASGVDLTFLGHGYFAEAISVLTDIHCLINKNMDPASRGLFARADEQGNKYWALELAYQ